jgi:membrane dipeptidase
VQVQDEQLRAVARNGGVVNINFYSLFIDPHYKAAVEAMDRGLGAVRDSLVRARGGETDDVKAEMARRRAAAVAALPRTPLSVLLDHFDHVIHVGGIDHVGIGSDFDGVSALPEGMEEITDLPRIAQGLLDRGYSETDVTKVLGGNMLRVMEQVLH